MTASRSLAAMAAEVSRLVRDIRRILRMRVRQEMAAQPLPAPAVELLRLVIDRPGLKVGEVARALRVAPNTTSTLVRQLTAARLLARTVDERDGRVARLHPTAAGIERLRSWRDHREALIAQALASLSADDVAAIEGSLPVLERLVRALDGQGPAGPSS